ncbi:MAG: response regulator [Zoogloeaceae bacterium]|jgi:twitching motility two-component system response regulator PilH|nr:response regulator [Zoogloeaceae bacterium]
MGLFDLFSNIIFGSSAREPESSYGEQERRLEAHINPREGTRVLIVDDSPTIAAVLRRFLDAAGCFCMEAPDAKVGLELALTQKPELVFLDIVMPGINGFAALRALRRNARTKDIPIIMMSGNEQATAQFFGTNIGADDFMKKPFSRDEVFSRIERLLDENGIPRRLYDENGHVQGVPGHNIPSVPAPPAEFAFQPQPSQFVHTPQAFAQAPVQNQPLAQNPSPKQGQTPVQGHVFQVQPPIENLPPVPAQKGAGDIDFDLSIFDVELPSKPGARPQKPTAPQQTTISSAPPQLSIVPPVVPPVPQQQAAPVLAVVSAPAPELLSRAPVGSSPRTAPQTPQPVAQLSQMELLTKIAAIAQQAQANPALLVELSALTTQLAALSSPQSPLQQTVSYLPASDPDEDEDPPPLNIAQE